MSRPRLDLVAVGAAMLALVMAVVYLWLMRQESDGPARWFFGSLILAAVVTVFGAKADSRIEMLHSR